jgi:DNA polymerase-3 subunit delta
MSDKPPVVYILNGDDEFAITRFVSELESKLGDPAIASLNTTRLDGRSATLEELAGAAGAMPFLARRRLVIMTSPTERFKSQEQRQRFLDYLGQIPETTALVLVENRLLTDDRDRRNDKLHWLEKWASSSTQRVFFKTFALPRGGAMVAWIQAQARIAGGSLSIQAAQLLVSLIGDEPRLAEQELHKLLAYVNYKRSIEPDDVQAITVDSAQGDIFAMVDALGSGDGRRATGMLQRLLDDTDALSIFGMVVRQFRLLILARECLDGGGPVEEVSQVIKSPRFVAQKIATQARQFTLPALEQIYRHLLELDEAIKTSQIDGDLALHTFIAAQTSPR